MSNVRSENSENQPNDQNGHEMAVRSPSEEEEKTDTSETPCRCGIWSFTAFAALCLFSYMLCVPYLGGSARMIERQFGLKSKQTGILQGIEEITAIFVQLIVAYLGDKYNRPRILFAGGLLVATSSFIMTLPHLLLWLPQATDVATGNITEVNKTGTSGPAYELCGSVSSNITCLKNAGESYDSTYALRDRAFYIFLVGRLLLGLGGAGHRALIFPYLHDNAKEGKAALFIGIGSAAFVSGPVASSLLSGICNRLPLDLTDWSIKPGDPRFIGCWWLGYVIAGVLQFLSCIPLMFFPASMKRPPPAAEETKPKARLSLREHCKDILRSLKQPLSRPAYLVYVGSVVGSAVVIVAILSNLVRYLEVHFRIPIFMANYYTAGTFTVPAVVGTMSSGVVVSHFRLRPVAIARMMIVIAAAGVIFLPIMMAFQCPQLQISGPVPYQQNVSLDEIGVCSSSCGCDSVNFRPVCGSDNMDYFSACHAGCTAAKIGSNKVENFTCPCIDGGWAVAGTCMSNCSLLVPYLITMALVSFCVAAMKAPFYSLVLSLVPPDTKTIAMGLLFTAVELLAFLPTPIIFGALVDSTCLLWDRKCGQTGSCLLYDTGRLRNYIHGGALAVQFLVLLGKIAGWWFVRRLPTEDETKNQNDVVDDVSPKEETTSDL